MASLAAAAAPLTEANQQEMQRQLAKLKKAKLAAQFERQDSLRPFGERNERNERNEERKEMKAEFGKQSKALLMKQSSRQYLLRLQSAEEVADNGADLDWDADCECDTPLPRQTRQPRQPQSKRKKRVSVAMGYGSDELAEMKAEFGKQSKAALTTQIEKSFELRVDGVVDGVVDDIVSVSVSESERGQRAKESERGEMLLSYRRLSKGMLSYRAGKQLETRAEPQIQRGHRRAFKLLLSDIGVVNESIVDALWRSIEDTVNENKLRKKRNENGNQKVVLHGEDEDEDEGVLFRLKRLEAENRALRRKLEQVEMQAHPLPNQDRQEDEVEDEEDQDMLIIN